MSLLKKKDPDTKEFSLADESLAELTFYTRELQSKEVDVFLWQNAVGRIKLKIMETLSLKSDEWNIDWKQAFINGKIVATRIKKEEVKKNG